MKLNAKVRLAILSAAMSAPGIALGQAAQKSSADTGDTTTGKAGVGSTTVLPGKGESSVRGTSSDTTTKVDRDTRDTGTTTGTSTSGSTGSSTGSGSISAGADTGSNTGTTTGSGMGTVNSTGTDPAVNVGTPPNTGSATVAPATYEAERANSGSGWGWMGLLGLGGLFGLARRPETSATKTTTYPAVNRSASAGIT